MMTRKTERVIGGKVLKDKTAAVKSETKDALQTMFDALNRGQQKKIVANVAVKALFDRYGVEYT